MNLAAKKKLIPPDGGWGWAIAVAFGINFFLIFSILPAFGLIYKNEFKNLGFSGTQSSFILSVNGGFSMLCGLVNGYLLNKFGTRKISICSAIFFMGGLTLTAFSTTFVQFLISYGIVTSIGIGMGMSSYSLALNQYFQKKRNKVTGYTTSVYGSGTILFPQLVSYLLDNYSIKETMLIIAAISGHTFVAAVLLQPIRWHMKQEDISEEKREKEEPTEEDGLCEEQSKEAGNLNVCNDLGAIHASMTSLHIYQNKTEKPEIDSFYAENPSIVRRSLNTVVKMFDLSLLTNTTFLVILIGLSIDFFVEFNLLWIIPFVLMDGHLSVDQTATFMSVYAIADIFCRFISPFMASTIKQSNRVMYIISLLLVVAARFFLMFLTDYISLLFVATATGGFRGMRLIYWSLVIPEYIPTERLAAAFGLLFTLNGLCMFVGGPILGLLRDISGNYKSCILFLNIISLTTVGMLGMQIIYMKIKNKKLESY